MSNLAEPEKKTIVCIGCPNGCEIEITKTDGTFTLEGNECKKGEEYAIEEFSNPKRILTTTIQVKNGILPLIPVRSDKPLPKGKLFDCMQYLSALKIDAPLKMGQILVENILDLGVNIIASRNLDPNQ